MHADRALRMLTPLCRPALPALQNKEVSGLAGGILEQWLRNLTAQTAVLMHPRYVQDPRKTLAARCAMRGHVVLKQGRLWCWVHGG